MKTNSPRMKKREIRYIPHSRTPQATLYSANVVPAVKERAVEVSLEDKRGEILRLRLAIADAHELAADLLHACVRIELDGSPPFVAQGVKRFHRQSCECLTYGKAIVFFDSREAALSTGMIPCKVCHP